MCETLDQYEKDLIESENDGDFDDTDDEPDPDPNYKFANTGYVNKRGISGSYMCIDLGQKFSPRHITFQCDDLFNARIELFYENNGSFRVCFSTTC